MKFLDVKTAFAFKKVFGSESSEPMLISFLNAILDYSGEMAIVELVILDPFSVSKLVPELKGMKDTYVNVRAKFANKDSVIIEMQVLNVEGFEQRILHSAAKEFSRQLKTNETCKLSNPVIAITFTNFVMFDDIAHYQSNFVVQEKTQFIQYSDDLELVFIELPKFTKTEDELLDIKDKWIYLIKNAGYLTCIPNALHEPRIEEALIIVNEANLSPEDLELQHRHHDFIRLLQGSLDLAREKGREKGLKQGLEEGLQQGLEQGREKGKIEMALSMIRNFNLSAEEVAAKYQIPLAELLARMT